MRRFVSAVFGLSSCFVSLALGADARAQDAATVREVVSHATLNHAGVVVLLDGDDDGDASGTLAIGPSSDSLRDAHPLVRVAGGRLVGSLFGLVAGTTYAVRVTVDDPDGGAEMRDLEITTRAEPARSFAGGTLQVAPGGSDTGDGTSSSPFATITHAVTQAAPGDTILVRRGAYHERVVIDRSGEPGMPIAIIAEMGTVLDGSYPELRMDTAWTSAGRGVWRASVEAEPGYVAVDDQRLYRFASEDSLRAGLPGVSRGGWSWDSVDDEVLIRLPDGLNPGVTDVRVGRYDVGITVEGQHDVWIEDLEVRYFGREDLSRGIVLRNSDRVVLRDLLVHHVSIGVEIDGGSAHVVEGTELYDRGASGWPPEIVEGTDADGTGVAFGGDLGPGHVLRDLSVHGFYRGIQPCGGAGSEGDLDVVSSLLFDIPGPVFDLDGTCINVRIVATSLVGVHAGFALAPASVGPTWIVRNAIFPGGTIAEMSGALATMLDTSRATDESGVVLLYHNSTRSSGEATPAATVAAGGWAALRGRNNVFAGTDVGLDLAAAIANLDLDYDAVWGPSGTARTDDGAESHADIASLFAALGIEENGIDMDPMFATMTMGDVSIGPGSPLVDRGVAIPGVNDDSVGGVPDIGAFEVGALDASTPPTDGGRPPASDGGTPADDGAIARPDGGGPGGPDSSTPPPPPPPGGDDDDDGCGCEAAGASSARAGHLAWPLAGLLSIAAVLGIARARRRRRSR